LRRLLRIALDPKRFIPDIANSIQNFKKINMMKSTDGLYVLRLSIDFVLKRSIERRNLKNIRNWKRQYSCVKNWGSKQRIACHYAHFTQTEDIWLKSSIRAGISMLAIAGSTK
jgi:hypothetical protein